MRSFVILTCVTFAQHRNIPAQRATEDCSTLANSNTTYRRIWRPALPLSSLSVGLSFCCVGWASRRTQRRCFLCLCLRIPTTRRDLTCFYRAAQHTSTRYVRPYTALLLYKHRCVLYQFHEWIMLIFCTILPSFLSLLFSYKGALVSHNIYRLFMRQLNI